MATLRVFINSATEMQQNEYLPSIAGGEIRFAVALPSLAGQTGTSLVRYDNGRVSGRVTGVADAGAATHFMIYLSDGHAAIVSANATGASARMNDQSTEPDPWWTSALMVRQQNVWIPEFINLLLFFLYFL